MTPGGRTRKPAALMACGQWRLPPGTSLHDLDRTCLLGMPSPPSPVEQLLLVTPAQAAQWVGSAPAHRNLAPERLRELADAMARRSYAPDPAVPVGIDSTGILRDGLARLKAVLLVGAAVPLWVALSPPVTARQVQLAPFEAPRYGLHVHAMRFDGRNADTIRPWPGAALTQCSVGADGALNITCHDEQNVPMTCTANPGDWIVGHPTLPVFLTMPPYLFVRMFQPKEHS